MHEYIHKLLDTLSGLIPEGGEAYLVGGTVRDILMGAEPADVDVAVSPDPGAFAGSLAERLCGSAFVMDEGRKVYRVSLTAGPVLQVDVSPIHGCIEEDLAARDFTINAMALPLTLPTGEEGTSKSFTLPPGGGGAGVGGIYTSAIIDPFGGREDLRAGMIRALGEKAFTDDPVRLLRAFRLSAALGFKIDDATLSVVRRLAGGITRVSPERVRDELYMIMNMDGTEGILRGMHAQGLLAAVLPELSDMEGVRQEAPHAYGLLEHSLKSVARCEEAMSGLARYVGENAGKVEAYLRAGADGAGTARAVVKFCALLHDSGKPSTMKVEGARTRFFGHDEQGAIMNDCLARRLRMSERARGMLVKTAALHMRPLNLSRAGPTGRAIHRLCRDAGDELPAIALVALADALATRESPDETTTDVEGTVRSLTDYYYGGYIEARVRPLVTGGELIEEFGLKPGPAIGRMLREVEEARAEGIVSDRQDAIVYIGKNLERYLG